MNTTAEAAAAAVAASSGVEPAGFSNDARDEVIKFGDSEEDFAFMIADSNALEDIAYLYDVSDDDIDDLQATGAHYVKKFLRILGFVCFLFDFS